MSNSSARGLNVLVVANLEHASPRIPGLSQFLAAEQSVVRVVTPLPDSDFVARWGIGELDPTYFRIIDAPYSGDILQIVRRLLWKIGLSRGKSLTEQLKQSSAEAYAGSKDNGGLVRRLRNKLPDWFLYKYQELFGIPDLEVTWLRSAYNTARKEIIRCRPDLIISSSPYATSHLASSMLVKRYGIPWIADYRDTWSNNPAYPFSFLRKRLDTNIERAILSRADRIITVSEAYRDKLKEIHPDATIDVIANGYTKLVIDDAPLKRDRKLLNIVYTGTIYEGFQNYHEFLAGLKIAIESGMVSQNSVNVNFYGRFLSGLDSSIRSFGLGACVFQNGVVPREEAFKLQREADLLLFFNWEGGEVGGLSHLKLYEYLGAQRPILVSGARSDDINESVVSETRSGFVGIGKESIGRLICDLASAKNGAGITYEPDMVKLRKHAYFERGARLHELIMRLLGGKT